MAQSILVGLAKKNLAQLHPLKDEYNKCNFSLGSTSGMLTLFSGMFIDCSFEKADLSGAILEGCFIRCNFNNVILDNVVFRDPVFNECVFKGVDFTGTKFLWKSKFNYFCKFDTQIKGAFLLTRTEEPNFWKLMPRESNSILKEGLQVQDMSRSKHSGGGNIHDHRSASYGLGKRRHQREWQAWSPGSSTKTTSGSTILDDYSGYDGYDSEFGGFYGPTGSYSYVKPAPKPAILLSSNEDELKCT